MNVGGITQFKSSCHNLCKPKYTSHATTQKIKRREDDKVAEAVYLKAPSQDLICNLVQQGVRP